MSIEKLAFKNIEELEPEDELILYDIIDFLQKDRKQWINQYTQVHNDYVDLKKQLEYLRSGEYLNQLKFERNMLEDIVQNMEISKEDKEFIDMTHRNTELLEENKELKEELQDLKETHYLIQGGRSNGKTYLMKLQQENQQLKDRINKAIEYMEQWGKEPDADMYMQMKDYNEFKYLLKILKEDNKDK